MKKCFKCGAQKPLSQFYKHPAMGDGHLGKCKECAKNDVKSNYRENIKDHSWHEKEKERGRDKYHRLNYRKTMKPTPAQKKYAMENYAAKFPEKMIARSHANGIEKKNPDNHLHHWSYNIEHLKDVIELTKEQHYTAHRFMIYDQERKMYRTKDGILLDTKKAHYNYIKKFF